jgi:hypothetical protein
VADVVDGALRRQITALEDEVAQLKVQLDVARQAASSLAASARLSPPADDDTPIRTVSDARMLKRLKAGFDHEVISYVQLRLRPAPIIQPIPTARPCLASS